MTGMVKVSGRYLASPGTLSDKQAAPVRCNDAAVLLVEPTLPSGGVLPVALGVPLSFNSSGPVASAVVTAQPAIMLDLFVFNEGNQSRYVHVFDATAVPANGAVPDTPPIRVWRRNNAEHLFAGGQGQAFSNGIVVALSTQRSQLQLAGADMFVNVQYRLGGS